MCVAVNKFNLCSINFKNEKNKELFFAYVQRKKLLLGDMFCVVDVPFSTNFYNKPFALFPRSFITFHQPTMQALISIFRDIFPSSFILSAGLQVSPDTALPHGIGEMNSFKSFFFFFPLDSQGASPVFLFPHKVNVNVIFFLISGQLKNMQSAIGPADVTLTSWSRISICHLQKCQCFNRGQESRGRKKQCSLNMTKGKKGVFLESAYKGI